MIEIKGLEGSEARVIDPQNVQWPDGSDVLYAVEQNAIVGRIGRIYLPIIEGAWVAEEKRGSSLAVRLMRSMEDLIKTSGTSHSFAHTYDGQPEIENLLARYGYKQMPLKIWYKELT